MDWSHDSGTTKQIEYHDLGLVPDHTDIIARLISKALSHDQCLKPDQTKENKKLISKTPLPEIEPGPFPQHKTISLTTDKKKCVLAPTHDWSLLLKYDCRNIHKKSLFS
ncbi:jg5881 [Pararge aegeria aegeria]|uniref:Jg5881 protein n=1 Tax=Pararge aegeria aegeria TaxID=348720 RepID=A0A8S4RDB9_9NEOP|nr:jg5881 [Pararge aegeria aegeria]